MKTDIPIGKTPRGKDFVWYGDDRATHMHVIGSTGSGKTKFLEHMLRMDTINPEKPGVMLIDPHGGLFERMVDWCAYMNLDRTRNIHIWNPSSDGWSLGFNPLDRSDGIDQSVKIDALLDAIAKVFKEDSVKTPQLRKYLRAIFHALYENGYSLVESLHLVSSKDGSLVREHLTSGLKNDIARHVWEEFDLMNERTRGDQLASVINRLSELLGSERMVNMFGQLECTINFKDCMDNGDIVLVNLNESNQLSKAQANLIGTLITNELIFAAKGREPTDDSTHPHPFYVVIDECYRYLNNDIEDMLDQTRKFGLHLTLAHQRLGQLGTVEDPVYNAVMSQALTKVVFRVKEMNDARAMSEQIFSSQIDLEEGVEMSKRAVLTGEYETVTLRNWGTTKSVGHSSSEGESEGESYYDPEEGEVAGSTLSSSNTSNESLTQSTSSTDGYSESLVPVYEQKYTERFSLNEQLFKATVKLNTLKNRQAYVSTPGGKASPIRSLDVPDAFITDGKRERFLESVLERDPYSKRITEIKEELEHRTREITGSATPVVLKQSPEEFDNPY